MSCDRNGEGRNGCGRMTCEKCYPWAFPMRCDNGTCSKPTCEKCFPPVAFKRKSIASLTVYNGPDGTPWEKKFDDNGCLVYNAPVSICQYFRRMEMRGDLEPSSGTLRVESKPSSGVAKDFLGPYDPVAVVQSNAATESLLCPHCRRSLRAIFSLHSSG